MISQELIEKFRINGRVDVVRLANDLGIKVMPIQGIENTFSSTNGYIQYVGDENFVIYVNPNQSKQRQRFSIAHELAHYIKHKEEVKEKVKVDRESVNSLSEEKEKEADKYAAEILMPKSDVADLMKKAKEQKPIDLSTVESLAERYDVSLYAMIIRLRELNFYVPYIDVYA